MASSNGLLGRLLTIVFIFVCALQFALAEPEAEPEAVAEAIPQGNVYQFSGAIYILGGNGGWCPAEAPQTCGGIPWCCASGCSCQQLAGGVVGCCPYGGTCTGPAPAVISTVTVYQSYPVTTTVQQVAPITTTTTTPNGVFVAGATTTETQATPVVVNGGYCSTLYAKGPNLPTTASGQCGTILVLNHARPLWPDASKVLGLFTMVWTAVVFFGAVAR